MADILVRGLEPIVVERLKNRAKAHGRSLQAEAKGILENATKSDPEAVMATIRKIRKKLGDRPMPDSTVTIRRDRNR